MCTTWLHNVRDGIINALSVAETGTQNLFVPLEDKCLQQRGHIKEMDKIQKSALALKCQGKRCMG
jgi:hypothetical protein